MLSEIEMTAFVGKHAVDEMRAVPAAPSDTLSPGGIISSRRQFFLHSDAHFRARNSRLPS